MATSKRTTRRAGGARSENGVTPPPTDAAAAPTASKARTRKPKATASAAHPRHHEDRHSSIARAAYFRSQMRGFQPGFELEDWLAAEAEVDRRQTGEQRTTHPMGKSG
jgi:Protein of unknown function (DUF2934)